MRSIDSIDAYDYGFGSLENKLVALFRCGAPDFETAGELLRSGADINADNGRDAESILSRIISGYWCSKSGDELCDKLCDQEECEDCPKRPEDVDLNPDCGRALVSVIRFFLDHGFELNRKNGRVGARCLWELTLSVYDRHMIEATKLLLDAGAKNISITEKPDSHDTPWDFIATEGSYQGTCCHNHYLGNLFEAVYQIYQAIEDGRDYSGIDFFEAVYGRRINQVFSSIPDRSAPFFDLDLPTSKHKNCFNQPLYFVTDNGVLITTQYADFWFDSSMPEVETIDVSDRFPSVVGSVVKAFKFDHHEIRKGTTCYGQPITTIEMDNGHSVTFTINFGEVRKEDMAAYYF